MSNFFGSHHWRKFGAACLVVMFVFGVFASGASAAEKSDVGANVAQLLKGYAGELYGAIAGTASLVFLLNRRYTELALFVCAAIVVGWLVFAPGDIAAAAEAIAKQVFG
jgi:hypothetical protein